MKVWVDVRDNMSFAFNGMRKKTSYLGDMRERERIFLNVELEKIHIVWSFYHCDLEGSYICSFTWSMDFYQGELERVCGWIPIFMKLSEIVYILLGGLVRVDLKE